MPFSLLSTHVIRFWSWHILSTHKRPPHKNPQTPNPLTVKCVKHARLSINSAFLSPVRYLPLIRPSVVTWHAFASATRIHITVTDTSGSEKVIAIATQGNQSWLLVTAQWKAAAELRLAACVYCAQGLAWWHPLFCTQQERGGSGSAEPHLSGHQSYLKRPTFFLPPATLSSNSHPNSHQLANSVQWERKRAGCQFNGTGCRKRICQNNHCTYWNTFECI